MRGRGRAECRRIRTDSTRHAVASSCGFLRAVRAPGEAIHQAGSEAGALVLPLPAACTPCSWRGPDTHRFYTGSPQVVRCPAA